MKKQCAQRMTLYAALLGAVLCAVTCPSPRAAQTNPAPVRGEQWSAIGRLPDFWRGTWFTRKFRYDFTRLPPLTKNAAAAASAYLREQTRGRNLDTSVANCTSPGMPAVMDDGSMPIKFLPTPEMIVIYLEGYSQARFVHMDGRRHAQPPNPTFLGESIGHWEGDTLVVDTIGFVPQVRLPVRPGSNPRAPALLPHGPNMRIVERFRILTDDTLEVKRTLHDDALFTQPVEHVRHFHRDTSREGELQEWVCSDNRDYFDEATGILYYGLHTGPTR